MFIAIDRTVVKRVPLVFYQSPGQRVILGEAFLNAAGELVGAEVNEEYYHEMDRGNIDPTFVFRSDDEIQVGDPHSYDHTRKLTA